MNDALGMYLVIKAEHAARLAEIAERERRRSAPRASSTRARWRAAVVRSVAWLRRSTRPASAADLTG